MASRVSELEARFTLQEDVIEKLNDALWRQQRELDALGLRVAELEGLAGGAAGRDEPAPPDDAPPHY